jgi:outer membrane biosynthesis protein TonB
MAKVPKGELTGAEIRKLIRGHNKLTNIKVPTGLDRDGLIKFLKSKKFEVDHKNKRLIDKSPARGKSVSLETAKAITKPKPKTALQKQKAEEAKAEKAEKKKKEERMIRKKAVEEEKKRAKPKPKTASIAVGTEEKKTSKNDKEKPAKKKVEKKDEIVRFIVGEKYGDKEYDPNTEPTGQYANKYVKGRPLQIEILKRTPKTIDYKLLYTEPIYARRRQKINIYNGVETVRGFNATELIK